MFEFPENLYLPLEKWIDIVMDWILVNMAGIFDAVGLVILKILIMIEKTLLWMPWPIVLLVIGVAAWRSMGKWWHALVMAGLVFLIGVFGFWDDSMRTLAVVIASVAVSLIIGFPTGIIMARSDRVRAILQPILDGMQTMPSFVYLIPAMMLFGLGKVPAVFATAAAGLPEHHGGDQPDNHDGPCHGCHRLHDRRPRAGPGGLKGHQPHRGGARVHGRREHRVPGHRHRPDLQRLCEKTAETSNLTLSAYENPPALPGDPRS
jgi:hypothetical protein